MDFHDITVFLLYRIRSGHQKGMRSHSVITSLNQPPWALNA